MYFSRGLPSARAVAPTLAYFALTLSLVLAACTPAAVPSMAVEPLPRTVSFANTTNSVVRVYLVSASSEWLLGRVQPVEVAQLRLPPGFALDRHEPVALAVVPLGAISPGGARVTGRSSALLSPNYPVNQLVAMRWGVSGVQLYSVMR
jgi:hypothetical protein